MARSSAPNGGDLWRQVSAADRRRVSQWNRGGQVISPTEYAATSALGPVQSPFAAIPLASQTAEFGQKTRAYEMIGYFDDDESGAMENYSWDDKGFMYENYASDQDGSERANEAPAPITIVPTSTTNPERPRTVAAGYDVAQQKLTVIFRDGTYYNYFEVTEGEWRSFKSVRSKGKYIREQLDWGRPRGVADVATIPAFARDTVYRFLRTGQKFRNGVQPKKRGAYKVGTKSTDLPRITRSRGQFGGTGVTMPKRP